MNICNRDILYTKRALELARQAFECGEVPVGAVVVDPFGKILGEGCNAVERTQSQSEHAEIVAIRAAGKLVNNWRLSGCSLYVTLEPCLMCMSLIVLSRIERLVYGAPSPRFGFSLDSEGISKLYTRQLKSIISGVCKDECTMLLEESFIQSRNQKNERKSGND